MINLIARFCRWVWADTPPKVYPDGEFDIEGARVISVERDTRQDVTVICVRSWLPDRDEVEYYLPVSPTVHNELVRRFRVKLKLYPSPVQPSSSPTL